MDKDYKPYGQDWEKEMMKLSKKELIILLKKELEDKQKCEGCEILD